MNIIFRIWKLIRRIVDYTSTNAEIIKQDTIQKDMKIIDFIEDAAKLKTMDRTGWKKMGLKKVESVADHTFRTTLLAILFSEYAKEEKNLDPLKLITMALVHELGEIIIGDIIWETTTFQDHDLKSQKEEQERQAVLNLLNPLVKDFPIARNLIELVLNYIDQEGAEALFLKEIDKLEMCFQALEYKKSNPELNFAGFFDTSDKYIEDPKFREIFIKLKDTYHSIE